MLSLGNPEISCSSVSRSDRTFPFAEPSEVVIDADQNLVDALLSCTTCVSATQRVLEFSHCHHVNARQTKGHHGITTGKNLQRSWSLRNPSLEGHERRRLAAIAGWPHSEARNPAGEPLKRPLGTTSFGSSARAAYVLFEAYRPDRRNSRCAFERFATNARAGIVSLTAARAREAGGQRNPGSWKVVGSAADNEGSHREDRERGAAHRREQHQNCRRPAPGPSALPANPKLLSTVDAS